jgi:hypothetical protein
MRKAEEILAEPAEITLWEMTGTYSISVSGVSSQLAARTVLDVSIGI